MAKAYEGNEPYIFISYSHKDSSVVMPVIEALQERGFLVWFDGGIEAGSEWPEYIASHIDNCGCMLNFVSKAYEDSFHCRSEMVYALDRQKPFLSVYLLDDDKVLSSGLRMQLGLNQALWKKNFANEEDFYDAVCSARALMSCKKGGASTSGAVGADRSTGTAQNQAQQNQAQNPAQHTNQNTNANFRQQPMGNMQSQPQNQRPNAFINGNGYASGNNMGANYNGGFGNGSFGNGAYGNRPAGNGYQGQAQPQNNFGGYQSGGQQSGVQRPMNNSGTGAPVSKLDAPVSTEGVYNTKKKSKGCLVTFIILFILAAVIGALLYFKPFGIDDLLEDLGFGDRVEDTLDDKEGRYEVDDSEDPREGLERHEAGELVLYLPDELEESYYEDDFASFESEDVYVSVLVEYFSNGEYDESDSLEEFAQDCREIFEVYGASQLKKSGEMVYFVYDDDEITYFTAFYKSSNAFWLVQSICYNENYDEFEDDFIKWAKLVETI